MIEAGRELDTQIAEKVMGWFVIETDDCNGIDNYWLSRDRQHVSMDDYGESLELPSYSTDIAAAWEVLDWIRPQRSNTKLTAANGWECHATNEMDDCANPANGSAMTAPHAICLCALDLLNKTTYVKVKARE